MRIVVKSFGIIKNNVSGKVFYIVLNCEGLLWESVTLCLPIPLVSVMYPWVSGRDKVGIRALAQFMHFGCNVCFLYCCGD